PAEAGALAKYMPERLPHNTWAPANGPPEPITLRPRLISVPTKLQKLFSPLYHPAMPDEAKKIFRERLAARFAHLDKHLASNQYLLGNNFSVADAYLFVVSNWAPRVDVDLAPYANVLAFRKRVGARPAVETAMKAEGLIK